MAAAPTGPRRTDGAGGLVADDAARLAGQLRANSAFEAGALASLEGAGIAAAVYLAASAIGLGAGPASLAGAVIGAAALFAFVFLGGFGASALAAAPLTRRLARMARYKRLPFIIGALALAGLGLLAAAQLPGAAREGPAILGTLIGALAAGWRFSAWLEPLWRAARAEAAARPAQGELQRLH